MANINIRIDEELKKEAESIFNELGLNSTTAITLFYKQVVRTRSIPFELKLDTPNEETIKAIEEIDEMEKHPEKYKTYESVDELMEDLLKWNTESDNLVDSKRILNFV